MVSDLTSEELAYIAGIVDGEGYIGIYKHPDNYTIYRTIVGVTNTDLKLVDWLHEMLGGNIYEKPSYGKNHKTQYNWKLNGTHIVDLLKAIRPYLRLKDEQADIILELESMKVKYWPGKGKFLSS